MIFGMMVLAFLAVAVPAFAEDASPGDKVVFKKKTLIDFSDVSIEGELRKPDGGYYGSRKRTRFNKLISVRKDFVPEIVSSTDNL
jgi:hypothetical protein